MKTGIFAACMLVPVIILAVALLAKARPQSRINSRIGYRSKRSMASQENWDKAQDLMARYLLVIGCLLTVVSAIAGILIVRYLEPTPMIIAYAILTLVQVIAIVLVIPLVESHLK
ncbi:MAG: SdpI family protein [Lachnospiraceae bacterium]|nr:SdpI family protein [Lachnospiraceae bacterium]